jgi:hypothetical protein
MGEVGSMPSVPAYDVVFRAARRTTDETVGPKTMLDDDLLSRPTDTAR